MTLYIVSNILPPLKVTAFHGKHRVSGLVGLVVRYKTLIHYTAFLSLLHHLLDRAHWHFPAVFSVDTYMHSLQTWLLQSSKVLNKSPSTENCFPRTVVKLLNFLISHPSADVCTGSRLLNTLNINSSHSLTKFLQPANLTPYTILSLFSLQVEPAPHHSAITLARPSVSSSIVFLVPSSPSSVLGLVPD